MPFFAYSMAKVRGRKTCLSFARNLRRNLSDHTKMESFQKKSFHKCTGTFLFLVNFISSLISRTPNLQDHFPAILMHGCTTNQITENVLHFVTQTKQFFRNFHLICIIQFVQCLLNALLRNSINDTFIKEAMPSLGTLKSHYFNLPNICVNTTNSDRQCFDIADLLRSCWFRFNLIRKG